MTTYVYIVEIRSYTWVFADIEDAKTSAMFAFAGKYKRAEIEQYPDTEDSWIIHAGTRNNMKVQGWIFREEVLQEQETLVLPEISFKKMEPVL